ncbi:MAG: hypothetical protein WCP34_17340, partial [Pseudomonadota bacterium]
MIDQRSRHPIQIHLLELTDEVGQIRWDSSLIAVQASVNAGWPTCFEAPQSMDLVKASDFLQRNRQEGRLSERLLPGHADAGVRIMEMRANQILSLGNLLSQGGRCLEQPQLHHVGLFLPPWNPYIRHLLMLLKNNPSAFFSNIRRLVPGQPQPAIVRRHLLLALREMEADARELLNTFQWQVDILDPILDKLIKDRQVQRRDVRYLDIENSLKVDTCYSSLVPEHRSGPLDTVGDKLLSLIHPQAGQDDQVLLQVDPERATILCYPGRVLRHAGKAYRIDRWKVKRAHDLPPNAVLTCTLTDEPALTWRLSVPRLSDFLPVEELVFDRGLNQQVIQVYYAEEVTGILEKRLDEPNERPPNPIEWGEPIE